MISERSCQGKDQSLRPYLAIAGLRERLSRHLEVHHDLLLRLVLLLLRCRLVGCTICPLHVVAGVELLVIELSSGWLLDFCKLFIFVVSKQVISDCASLAILVLAMVTIRSRLDGAFSPGRPSYVFVFVLVSFNVAWLDESAVLLGPDCARDYSDLAFIVADGVTRG